MTTPPVMCTAGWSDDPCPYPADPGGEVDGKPACLGCVEDSHAYDEEDE